MQEIIPIQIGRCGNTLSQSFWEAILDEHHINPTGTYTDNSDDFDLHKLNVFFNETTNFRYMPRSVFIDLEPGILDSIRAGKLGRLFKQSNFVSSQYGAGSNWVKGFYTEGAELAEMALDAIRKESEACDGLQGFQISHSLGGGTGSGMGCLLMSKLKEEYPSKIIQTFSVFPSKKVSDVVVEPYNAMLSMTELIDSADLVHVFDNEALHDICFRCLKLSSPKYSDINDVATRAMALVTSSLRFKGQLNSNLRSFACNMVPFPKLHFLIVSSAPVLFKEAQEWRSLKVSELVQAIYDPKNMMCAADPRYGKHLTMSAIFRGKISQKEVDEQFFYISNRSSTNFVWWIPNNFKTEVYDIPAKNFSKSGSLISNSTSIQEIFKNLNEQFTAIFRKKTSLHWYTDEGLDEMEFIKAEAKVDEVVSGYQQMQDAGYDDDDYDAEYY